MCVFIGAQSNPAADARKDEEIRSLQDQLEKMRLDNANKDSAIEKLVSNKIFQILRLTEVLLVVKQI